MTKIKAYIGPDNEPIFSAGEWAMRWDDSLAKAIMIPVNPDSVDLVFHRCGIDFQGEIDEMFIPEKYHTLVDRLQCLVLRAGGEKRWSESDLPD